MENSNGDNRKALFTAWTDTPASSEFSWEALLQSRLIAVQQFADFKSANADEDATDEALDRVTDIEQRCSEIATRLSADSVEAITLKFAHWILDQDFQNPRAVIDHPSDALAVSCFRDLLKLTGQTELFASPAATLTKKVQPRQPKDSATAP